MAAFVGILGDISWAGTQNTRLITTAAKPIDFTLNLEALEFDTTAFAALGIATFIKGLSSWSGTIRLRTVTAQTGDQGLVTFSGGYVTNLNRWDMTIETAAHETTPFGVALTNTAYWRTFIPGVLRWSGGFGGYQDGSTVLTWPGNSSEPATGTFKLREAGATDHNFAGSIFTTRLGAEVSPNGVATASYSYRGSGALTESNASDDSLEIFTADGGVVARPTVGELVLTATTGQTFTGDAFWTAVRISNAVNEMTTIEIDFQGTDDLAAA